jgi:hypothetical protein
MTLTLPCIVMIVVLIWVASHTATFSSFRVTGDFASVERRCTAIVSINNALVIQLVSHLLWPIPASLSVGQ